MVGGDFDIEGLAAYMHLSPNQIVRLAERGDLPCRKVAGQWRFSRAEVHHWMEARMGVLDDTELAHVEGALKRSAGPASSESLTIAELLPLEATAVPLAARTRSSAIRSISDLAAKTGLLWDAPKMAEAVRAREDMQPTALDNGVALLHPRRPLPNILAQPFLAVGITGQGIPFGGSRGILTDIFFLICSTDDSGHLRVLARLSRLLSSSELLEGLRSASDAATVHRLIADCEGELTT